MGTLYYGDSQTPIGIEDRALTHLKVVLITKLRRGESFTLSWRHPENETRGRQTLWLHESIPLRFVFDEPTRPQLSRSWIEALMKSANSTGGIELVDENLNTEPVPTVPGQPVTLGADVQPVELSGDRRGVTSGVRAVGALPDDPEDQGADEQHDSDDGEPQQAFENEADN